MQSAIQNFKTRLFNSITPVDNNQNEQEAVITNDGGGSSSDEQKETQELLINDESRQQMAPEKPTPPPMGHQLSQSSIKGGLANKFHKQLTREFSNVSTDR